MVEQNTKWLVGERLHRQIFLPSGNNFGVASRLLEGGKSVSAPLTVSDKIELFNCRFWVKVSNVRDQVFLAWLGRLDCVRIERWAHASRKRG